MSPPFPIHTPSPEGFPPWCPQSPLTPAQQQLRLGDWTVMILHLCVTWWQGCVYVSWPGGIHGSWDPGTVWGAGGLGEAGHARLRRHNLAQGLFAALPPVRLPASEISQDGETDAEGAGGRWGAGARADSGGCHPLAGHVLLARGDTRLWSPRWAQDTQGAQGFPHLSTCIVPHTLPSCGLPSIPLGTPQSCPLFTIPPTMPLDQGPVRSISLQKTSHSLLLLPFLCCVPHPLQPLLLPSYSSHAGPE